MSKNNIWRAAETGSGRRSAELTFDGAEARHLLGHQRPVFVFAVDLCDLLPTLAALGSGQSRNGFLPADLALRLLLPQLQPGRQLGDQLLLLVERRILVGALDRRRDGGHLRVGFTDKGAAVIVARPSGLDGGVLEDLVGRLLQHARGLGLVQLALVVADWKSLALRSSPQVAVAVNAVKVFRDGVLVVVAVQTKFLFGPVGMVHVLRGGNRVRCQRYVVSLVLLIFC